jgi:plastocyanin
MTAAFSNMKKYIIIIIALVAAAGGGTYLNTKYGWFNFIAAQSILVDDDKATAATAAIIFTGTDGFVPSAIIVHVGDSVVIRNYSNVAIDVESNPHPIHTDDTELNVGRIEAGQNRLFVVKKKGTYTYHDELKETLVGQISIR